MTYEMWMASQMVLLLNLIATKFILNSKNINDHLTMAPNSVGFSSHNQVYELRNVDYSTLQKIFLQNMDGFIIRAFELENGRKEKRKSEEIIKNKLF